MRFVIYSVIVLFVAAGLTIFAKEDPGYVMLTVRGWTIETTAVIFSVGVLLAAVAIYIGLRLLVATGLMPRRLRRWRKTRNQNIGRKSLTEGMMKLNLGHWYKAERLLIKAARSDDLAALAYMAAARAAQGQGIKERRDGYLQLAKEKAPKSTPSLTIALAQLQADDGDTEQAIKTLQKLPASHHNEPRALKLLNDYYIKQNNYSAQVELLPRLRSNKVLPQCQYYETEHNAYAGLIKKTAQEGDCEKLMALWKKLPKDLYSKEDVVADYCCALINLGQSDIAEDVLYRRISKSWNDSLVYLYGLLDGDAEIHLTRARNWYKKHQDNPILLLSMGRLAMRAHQWQEARTFLEKSLQITPIGDTYQELGNLLTFQNEQGPALECYRRGLALNSEHSVQPELKTGNVIKAKLASIEPLTGETLLPEQNAQAATA